MKRIRNLLILIYCLYTSNNVEFSNVKRICVFQGKQKCANVAHYELLWNQTFLIFFSVRVSPFIRCISQITIFRMEDFLPCLFPSFWQPIHQTVWHFLMFQLHWTISENYEVILNRNNLCQGLKPHRLLQNRVIEIILMPEIFLA